MHQYNFVCVLYTFWADLPIHGIATFSIFKKMGNFEIGFQGNDSDFTLYISLLEMFWFQYVTKIEWSADSTPW